MVHTHIVVYPDPMREKGLVNNDTILERNLGLSIRSQLSQKSLVTIKFYAGI